ncbi:MAG: hypothetical protein CMJ64_18040 [Planctomycetaceae bacterium]|nr:hypothetical protein [Planctomycetaceae bacterium]
MSQKEDILSNSIESSIAPDSWDNVGGPGTAEGIYDSLVISQSDDVHEQVAGLLQTYRELMKVDASPEGLGVRPLMVGLERTEHLLPALERPLTMIIRDEPLLDAMAVLVDDFQVPIVIDAKALEDFGISTDTPITGRFAEVPLRVALKRLLKPIDLTYTLRNEVIMITTPEQDEAMLQIGLYPVGNLVRDGSDDPANYDFDSLIEVITSTVAPDAWDEVGGPGAIDVLLPAPALVIAQTHEIHEQITKLLVTLEAAKQKIPKKEAVDPDAITLKAYHQRFGFFFESAAIIEVLKRDLDDAGWDEDGVFVEPLGRPSWSSTMPPSMLASGVS